MQFWERLGSRQAQGSEKPKTNQVESVATRPWNIWDDAPEGPWSRDAFIVSPEQECSLDKVRSEAKAYLENALEAGNEPIRDRLQTWQSRDYAEPLTEEHPNFTVYQQITSDLRQYAMLFAIGIAQKYGIAAGRGVTTQEWYAPKQTDESWQLVSINGKTATIESTSTAGYQKPVRATDIYENRVADEFLDYWYKEGSKTINKDQPEAA